MIVKLTPIELLEAQMCALARHVTSMVRRSEDRHGMKHDGYETHMMGACGEIAAAKALGFMWIPTVDTFRSRGDIGKIEVKTRQPGYELMIRPDDRDAPFVLVISNSPEFDVAGWFPSEEAKKKNEWLKSHGGRPPAFFVPMNELKPLEELMAYERDPNELGSIFVSLGKGNYDDTYFFGGRAFDIPDGTYELSNVKGVSKKSGQAFHLIRVCKTEPRIDVDAEIARAKAAIDGEEAPF